MAYIEIRLGNGERRHVKASDDDFEKSLSGFLNRKDPWVETVEGTAVLRSFIVEVSRSAAHGPG